MSTGEMIMEPARQIPVLRRCDVLVVGGGPAGTAAAAAAAQAGADTLLVERYGHLGGMSTGGLVLWIDRMSDWSGRQVISGFANDLLGRMPKDALLGPPPEVWGSKDRKDVEYWGDRRSAYQGTVTWSPTVDPEMLKMTSLDILTERGAKLLLHSWAVGAVHEGNEMRGIIFESKSGRQAILAKVIVDCTGDGDIFAAAGAPFESESEKGSTHETVNVAFRWGGVDYERYTEYRFAHKAEFEAMMNHASATGVLPPNWKMQDLPSRTPRPGTVFFMGPRLFGYNCIDVEDLTACELDSRHRMMMVLDFFQKNVPGYKEAWVMETAPQMGVRHSRRVVGVKKVTRPEWLTGKVHEDEVGVCPPRSPEHPNVSIPLGCLVPESLDNLLVAGRNLSSDPPSHGFLREVPVCWVMGQAAGTAAALAVNAGVRVRDVDVRGVQRQLVQQGAYLHDEIAALATPMPPHL